MRERIPPHVEELLPAPDPARCCELLDRWPHRLFLDSAVRSSRLGRYSFLTADPVAVVRGKGSHVESIDRSGAVRVVPDRDALETVKAMLAPFQADPVPGRQR